MDSERCGWTKGEMPRMSMVMTSINLSPRGVGHDVRQVDDNHQQQIVPRSVM